MVEFAQETLEDAAAVEGLFDLSFAPGRTALSSYQLRGGAPPVAALCRLARDEFDVVVGAIRYWPVRIEERAPGRGLWPALLLGPVAVHPIRQGEGLAAALISDTLERAAARGWSRVILVGDAPYYGRFGFARAPAEGLTFPPPVNPQRVLARELAPGAMAEVRGDVAPWPAGAPISAHPPGA
ncbi:MAG: N-acetyltransferase [Pseudomonadota bacterium]